MGKILYVTTAIPYVNGKPHIGNALDYLLADIWARYQRMNGHEVVFQVGTDEHGNKIAAKASELGLHPQDYTDSMYGNFEELMKKVGATYSHFVRTTDEYHVAAVQYIWQQLQPYIYKGTYEGWYCQGCESFVTDKEATANNGVCPDHNTPYQRLSEENYYLRTSEFTSRIRQAIETGKMKIVPEFRKREFLEMLKDGIPDVSISRPKRNLSWGVPVPGDPDQVMYVWLDALSNYITVIGYPTNPQWREVWPADVQVIGKDILRFHAGIWPAMLLGLGLDLPRVLLVHGHVNVGGTKMSKSLGNVELGNDFGNLVQRVASMITRYQAGVIGDITHRGEHDMQPYRQAMAELSFDRALDEVWVMIRSLNKYLENVKPWEIARDRDTNPDASAHLSEVLAYSAGMLLQIADLLAPVMPSTSEAIHKLFGSGVVQPAQPLFPKRYIHTPDPRAKTQK